MFSYKPQAYTQIPERSKIEEKKVEIVKVKEDKVGPRKYNVNMDDIKEWHELAIVQGLDVSPLELLEQKMQRESRKPYPAIVEEIEIVKKGSKKRSKSASSIVNF